MLRPDQGSFYISLHKTSEFLKKTISCLSLCFAFSVAMQTFAVIGVNTALIQAAVMARGKVHTAVPGKVSLRANLPQGNIKLEVLPAVVPDHVAAIR